MDELKRRKTLSEAEWSIVEKYLFASGSGVPREHRTVFSGILWILENGAKWRELPEGYGAHTTVCRWYNRWKQEGILHELLIQLGMGNGDPGLYKEARIFPHIVAPEIFNKEISDNGVTLMLSERINMEGLEFSAPSSQSIKDMRYVPHNTYAGFVSYANGNRFIAYTISLKRDGAPYQPAASDLWIPIPAEWDISNVIPLITGPRDHPTAGHAGPNAAQQADSMPEAPIMTGAMLPITPVYFKLYRPASLINIPVKADAQHLNADYFIMERARPVDLEAEIREDGIYRVKIVLLMDLQDYPSMANAYINHSGFLKKTGDKLVLEMTFGRPEGEMSPVKDIYFYRDGPGTEPVIANTLSETERRFGMPDGKTARKYMFVYAKHISSPLSHPEPDHSYRVWLDIPAMDKARGRGRMRHGARNARLIITKAERLPYSYRIFR